MLCPKCLSPFEKVATSDGVIDRCTNCRGLWFDLLEHEEVKQHAAAIDIGNADTGMEYNQIDDITCPVCPKSKMLKMVEPSQPHIWFESCPTCYGRFYDAGEYLDLTEFTISDVLKRLFTAARD